MFGLLQKAAKVMQCGCRCYFWQHSYFGIFFANLAVKSKNCAFMKKYLGFAIVTVSLVLVSFAPLYSIDDVVAAMRTGNATQLSKYFDGRVDLSLPGKSDNYSKSQAEMILKDFFANNTVKNFIVKHKGEQNGSQFCIGLLQTKNGNFRTKFFMKQKGDQQVVQELGFEVME
ncbi:DUF4783 domain-containing protein [Niastella caeni]|uniref:DUF4783 domain-containing protein n=1 Tax=Niastella caeni TaxID=2569763 RepID=A0A4S8I040_9BACT|nr:DUF4783 domain-containing protein [Niastella caeni]